MDLLILVVTCAINLTLGLFVLLRDTKKIHTRLFVFVTILISVWIAANYVTNNQFVSLDSVNAANKLTFVSGFGLILSELLFTYQFPVKRTISPRAIWSIALVSFVMVVLSVMEVVAGVATRDVSGKIAFSVGDLIWVYIVGFLVMIVLMGRNLLAVTHDQGEAKVRQARLILLAFGGTASVGIILNAILPAMTGDWSTTQYTPLVTVVLVAIIAYTIVKHGLFDIRLAVVRGVAYVFSLATLAGAYFLAAYGASQLLINNHESIIISQSPLSITLALVLAFIFQPIRRFFDRLTNSIFYRDNYDTNDFLARLGTKLSAASDLRDLLQRAADEISGTLQAEQGLFFVRYSEDRFVNAGTKKHSHMSPSDVALLDVFTENNGSSAVVTDLLPDNDAVHKLLKRHRIGLVLPLMHNGKTLSYLLLGHRRSREYTAKDVRVLETISNELGIAIQNALSLQEVKDINETLQQRIEEATKELRMTNLQLQRLDEAKDEFVSMASHQLRTPLTSVKGYISMVLEGDVGRISAMQRQLLEEAFTSSERMVHLISDFLNISRLQTGKFMIDHRATDLPKIIRQEVDSLDTTATAHNLKLEYRPPSYFPLLYIDESKIRQVVMNFIDNAIYYSKEDTTIRVELAVVDGSAVLQVRDTGIGVPKTEQSHLFTKFFRATNARKHRPDGTGVGLFLAKKVILAHGGTVVFNSIEGEGSTFGFRLPINQLGKAPAVEDTNELNNEP